VQSLLTILFFKQILTFSDSSFGRSTLEPKVKVSADSETGLQHHFQDPSMIQLCVTPPQTRLIFESLFSAIAVCQLFHISLFSYVSSSSFRYSHFPGSRLCTGPSASAFSLLVDLSTGGKSTSSRFGEERSNMEGLFSLFSRPPHVLLFNTNLVLLAPCVSLLSAHHHHSSRFLPVAAPRICVLSPHALRFLACTTFSSPPKFLSKLDVSFPPVGLSFLTSGVTSPLCLLPLVLLHSSHPPTPTPWTKNWTTILRFLSLSCCPEMKKVEQEGAGKGEGAKGTACRGRER
jgi:hypothetical protein